MLALAPADAADLVVRNKGGVGPDPVFVKPSTDAPRERDQIAEVHEHHCFAKGLAMDDQHLERDEQSGGHAEPEREAVIRWRWTRPDKQRTAFSAPVPHEL